jgi:hypothetical protein
MAYSRWAWFHSCDDWCLENGGLKSFFTHMCMYKREFTLTGKTVLPNASPFPLRAACRRGHRLIH